MFVTLCWVFAESLGFRVNAAMLLRQPAGAGLLSEQVQATLLRSFTVLSSSLRIEMLPPSRQHDYELF